MATEQPKGTSFVVHLNDLNLPDDQKAIVARAIQGAVLNEIARFDFGREGGLGLRIPLKEWLGLWLERVGRQEIPIPRVTFGPR